MYCSNCEFEIKGEGRKECPICGGPLIDFSSLASETPEDMIDTPEEKPTDNPKEPPAGPTFDLASLLNDDEEPQKQDSEPEAPPVESLRREDVGQTNSDITENKSDLSTSGSKESTQFDFESALTAEEEKQSPAPETEQAKEDLFNFETAFNEDEAKQSPESEEPAQVSSVAEHKPESKTEPPLEELSTKELLRRIAEEYKPAAKDVEEEPAEATAPTPENPKPVQARPSRSISAIAALAVFALMAAIASIAYLAPQEKLHPTIVNLKTEAEKKINAITDLVIINVEKYLYQQEESSSTVPQQKTRTDKPVKKTSFAKKPPVQEKTVPVETKPAVVTKIIPAENKQTVPKEPAQPQAETAKEILPLQEKPASKIVEKKEKTPLNPTGTKPSRGSPYSLHTGSFVKESIASAETERLKRMGFNSYIQKISLKNGQTWYRIKVGDFNTRNEAKEILNKLKQKVPHIKAYVMKKRIPAKATLAGEIAADSKQVAITDPAVSTTREVTKQHEDSEVVEKQQPVKEAVTEEKPSTEMNDLSEVSPPLAEKPQETVEPVETLSFPEETLSVEAEQIIPDLSDIPEIPQTMVEIPQEIVESTEEISSPEEVISDEEEIIAEIGYNPYTQEKEEAYPEDAVSIETLPGITPEQEDQASAAIELLPETGIQQEQEEITPTE
jgi:cell division protein FtsN